MEDIEILKKINRKIFLKILISPVLCLFTHSKVLVKSLLNCNALVVNGKWSNYLSFDPISSLVKLFYITQIDNIDRYGLLGNSPTIAGGISMKIFWYHSVISLRIFKVLGCVGVIIAMFFWTISHFIWVEQGVSFISVLAVLLLAVLSNNFLGNLFCKQNYNVFGWAWFPLFLYALFNGYFIVIAMLLGVVSFFSVTAFVAGGMFVVGVFLVSFNKLYLAALFPALLKWFVDIYVFCLKGNIKQNFSTTLILIMKFIGLKRENFSCKRPIKMFSPIILTIVLSLYPVVIYFVDVQFLNYSSNEIVFMLLIPVIWMLFNQTHILRFADPQSIFIVNLSLTAVVTIYSDSPFVYIAFWLVNNNPVINIILFSYASPFSELICGYAPYFRPFDHTIFTSEMKMFLSSIQIGESIHLACCNPGTNYNALFDGYSSLYMGLIYFANLNDIVITPDYYSIFYKQNSVYWGRSVTEVVTSLRALNTKLAIVYIEKKDLYDIQYWGSQREVKIMSRLNWDMLVPYFKGTAFESMCLSYWLLLRFDI